MINYVKSLGEIYQQSSDIATAFKHSGNTMEQVDQSSSSATVRPGTASITNLIGQIH